MQTKIIKTLFLSYMLFLVHCGGSHNSASSRMIIFLLPQTTVNESLNFSLSEEIRTSDAFVYTATFYTNENTVPSSLAAGPFDASEYNVADGSYFINPRLANNAYWLVFKLVKRVDHEIKEITLSQTEILVEVNNSIVTVDLTRNTFSDAFDADEDGFTNIEELNSGTDPLDPGMPDNSLSTAEEGEQATGNPAGASDSEETHATGDDANGGNALPDSDDDGLSDTVDNCPTLANDDQADLDSDAEGDACDGDDDGDGVTDEADNCPQTLASVSLSDDFSDQTDADVDSFGVACDCDDTDASFNPQAEDRPDTFVQDTNCDGIDGNVNAAVFASPDGSGTATGLSPDEPTADLQTAIEMASSNGFYVCLAVGEYELTDLELADGISLYGGFSPSFDARQSIITDGNKTTLYLNSSTADDDWTVLLSMTDFEAPVTLASLELVSTSRQSQQILLSADNAAHVTLEHNHFTGSESADAEFLITLEGTDANISANYFSGRASETSVGISSEDSRGTLTNNIFNMGSAQHTTAVELSTSEFDVLNNTIDGGRHEHGTAFGLDFSNSVLTLINNIFITQNSNYQASFRCQGPAPESPVTLFNNLFLRYSSDGIVYPAYITCSNGRDLLITEDELDDSAYASELNTSDNTVDNRTQDMDDASAGLSTMLDETFQLVTEDENPALNSGQDVSDFDVTHDFWRNLRSATPDLGAHESE